MTPDISTTVLQNNRNICLFSKHLQWLDFKEMAETAKRLGFDGIDLTVRPKGHVLPEKVKEDLPKAVEAIRNAGLEIPMMTTAIKDAKDPLSVDILKTAGELGINYYRMGWYRYDFNKNIAANLDGFKSSLSELAEINEKYQVKGAYQNHSGNWFGSAVWDLSMILDLINSEWMGCQYDIRHAQVEGGNSWPLGMKKVSGYINTLDIKDFVFIKKEGEWKVENVPLGEGMVNFQEYVDFLNQLEIKAPVSIHYEYPLGGAEHGATHLEIPEDQVLKTIKKDLLFLRNIFGS